MSYNLVILKGIIIQEPIFFNYQEKERLEIMLSSTEGSYKDKDGNVKKIRTYHKVLIYNTHYVEKAKKNLLCKGCKILVKGKLSSVIDSNGCYNYCVYVSNNNHYLNITSDYFLTRSSNKNVRNFLEGFELKENKPIIKDDFKISEFSKYRELTIKYGCNITFQLGIVVSHITARMVKPDPNSEAVYKTLDFILRVENSYLNKTNNEKANIQNIKVVITSKKIIEYVIKNKVLKGDLISIQGMLITKDLPRNSAYNRTQHIELSSFIEHNLEILQKSKLNKEFEKYILETGNKEIFLNE
ncbi:MAG: hypothetical protein RL027_610 [Pseudomonadota bacterium]|jgi:single-stranded DNA-binding protein